MPRFGGIMPQRGLPAVKQAAYRLNVLAVIGSFRIFPVGMFGNNVKGFRAAIGKNSLQPGKISSASGGAGNHDVRRDLPDNPAHRFDPCSVF